MANDFYNSTGAPSQGAPGSSAAIRAQFAALAAAFDKLPALTGNGGKFTRISDGGTSLIPSTQLSEQAGSVSILGNLGIGTGAPSQRIEVAVTKSYGQSADVGIALGGTDNGFVNNGTASAWRSYVAGDANGQNLRFEAFIRGTGWTERMRINSAGMVLISATGTVSGASESLSVAHGGRSYTLGVSTKSGGGVAMIFTSDGVGGVGTITTTSVTTAYNTTSDYRLKDNV